MAQKAGVTFAQFVMMTPFPGTIDFERWEKREALNPVLIEGTPITRYWLIRPEDRPKMFTPHPTMSAEEIQERTQGVWNRFYSLRLIWARSSCVSSLRGRMAFVLISRLYRQMYANTGISADSARKKRSNRIARWMAKPCRLLFQAKPMPNLEAPAGTEFLKSPVA
jgi:hypothetical protein